MTDLLDNTLAHWRSTAFIWGETDCLLSVGDYLAVAGYRDVASWFRGRYTTEEAAMRHVERYGGHDALIDLTGAPRTEEPQRGDVVVLDAGETEVSGLCTGEGVVLRLERGTIEIERRFVHIVAAWRV